MFLEVLETPIQKQDFGRLPSSEAEFLGLQMLVFVSPSLFLVRQSLCLHPHLFLKTSFYLWCFTKHASLHVQPNPRGVEAKA